MTISLSDYLAQLTNAAGPGAAHIASSVTARGNAQAKIGAAGPRAPGPALQSILARSSGQSTRASTATDSSRVSQLADRMAKDALRQGAELLSGGQ